MSASPASTGSRIAPSCRGSCCPSPSTRTARSKSCSKAYRKPVWTAPPIPRLNGRRMTRAPRAAATCAVRSTEPSSTTTTSKPGSKARISSITWATLCSSFSAGTIATRRSGARRSRRPSRSGASCTSSATDPHGGGRLDPDELEQAPRAVGIGVLVEGPLARAAPELLGRARIREQLLVGADGPVRVLDDEQLAARLEPALDAGVRIRDDRRARHRELEGPRGRRRRHARMRSPGHVEVDPRRRDRAIEPVERDVADEPRPPGVALEVTAAEREIHVGKAPARLADELPHRLAPELVAVAVEEDVDVLLDVERLEELRVCGPEDGLGATGAELEETRDPALGVRDHQVVLRRVRSVVVVEARVHPAVLGQAHRDVAVVEDDRNAEPLTQRRRDAAEVRHRYGEDDDRVDVALALEDPLEMALPARRDPAPDQLALAPVGVAGIGLGPPEVAVSPEPRGEIADPRVGLALAEGRVGRRAPPGTLDRPAAVGGHNQVDAGLVHPLPELPPGGGTAVAIVEVDRGGDREDLGR